MKSRVVVLFVAGLLAGACHSKNSEMKRSEQSYEVVQEGDTTGSVTSTISGPGETPPPVTTAPPLTGTNADTTTAFTLPGTIAQTTTQTSTQTFSSTGTFIPQPARPRVVRQRDRTTITNTPPAATDTVAVPTRTDTTDTTPTTTQEQPPPPPPTNTTDTAKPPR